MEMRTKYKRNILRCFAQATPAEITSGVYWYERANATARLLAETFGVEMQIACMVISALSPNNSWTRNLSDAWRVVRCWFNTKDLPVAQQARIRASLSTCTYGANKVKAFDILDGKRTELGGLKTQNFARNLAGCEQSVTIDVHAFSIANNKRFTAKSMRTITPKVYAELALAYTEAAAKVGIQPSQLQAVTWQCWRRIHGLTTASELTPRLFE